MDGAARGDETRGVEKHVENRVDKHGNIHRQGARGRGRVEINRFIQGWRTAFPRLWNISGKGMNRIAYRGVRGGMLLTPYAFYGKVTVEE